MKFLNGILKDDVTANEFLKSIQKGELPLSVSGLSGVHRALFCVAATKQKCKAVIITPDEATATVMLEDITAFGKKAAIFPIKDFCFSDAHAVSKEYEYRRIDTLSKILDGHLDLLLVPAEAAVQYTVPPEILSDNIITLAVGEEVSLGNLTDRLLSAGYHSCQEVEGAGQFSRRGGILDVYPVNMPSPVRIEFWGDEIDNINEFDILSQRRTNSLDKVKITQAGEIVADTCLLAEKLEQILLEDKKGIDKQRILKDISALKSGINFPYDRYLPLIYKKATVFDYMPDAQIIAIKFSEIKENLESVFKRYTEDYLLYSEGGFILPGLEYLMAYNSFEKKFSESVFLDNFLMADYPFNLKNTISADYKGLPAWKGDISVLLEDINAFLKKGTKCVILAGKSKAAQIIYDELKSKNIDVCLDAYSENGEITNKVTVMCGGLSGSFSLTGDRFVCITAGQIFSSEKVKKHRKNENSIGSLDELKKGDYVVHSIHGIGIFDGINKITNGGVVKDYIKIIYAKTDVLYVPVIQLDLISKYIGAEAGNIRLNKLGSGEWHKTRARVKHAVKEMAKELTALYAKRQSVKGYAFSKDTELQADFEAKFPYAETADQIRSAAEIKADMEREIPMDRLLCGDVGFGKTEVALRAAFKCVSEGKQCAILVPTTILAFQHYNTVLRRFGELPINVKMLSRFVTPKEQKKIISDLSQGKVDLIIGTHRLISDDVKFRNLGLAIIDEEQRFGVAQKEKLKTLYPYVDVLTLSATPIPRTLNMAMSGLRDMSTIEQAPGERLPVQSYVLEYNKAVVIDAIRKELRRSGQVYYLYNRTEDIERKALILKESLPEANIAVAHGKMSEDELSRVWQRLLDHEIDILVCTTIIETGVDVPNANTLIIEDADRLGLSQLHQLRGRVGRSPRRAYAYFCFRENKALSDIAEKRLEAIRQFTEFGAGFKIALRDLELRGAGNILGGEQHGNMEAVGYDMYIKLLNEAVNEENGIVPEKEAECVVDLNISAHIPERYIESLPARLGIYKRISAIENENQKMDVLDELIDRFGEPPKAVMGLIDVALLRRKAAKLGIYEITEAGQNFILKVEQVSPEQLDRLMSAFSERLVLKAEEKPYYEVRAKKSQTRAEFIQEMSCSL